METRVMNDRIHGNRVASALVAAILVAIVVLSLGAGTAWASPLLLDNVGSEDTVSVLGGQGFKAYTGYTKKVSAPKSSNTAVATVKMSSGAMVVTAKKAGKTKITCTLGGKKKSFTLVVKKYKNPVKTLKVGAKNYASKFKNSRSYHDGHAAGKLTIRPAAGWKLVNIYGNRGALKNGQKIENYGSVQVELKNQKTGMTEFLSFA